MAKHLVKCRICGEVFDTNTTPYVKENSRRYIHASCSDGKGEVIMPQPPPPPKPKPKSKPKPKEKEVSIRRQITDYVQSKLGKSADINWVIISQQINNFIEKDNFTETGILKTLKYFCENKGGKLDTKSGIAIVKYQYQEAYEYYKQLHELREETKNLKLVIENKYFTIAPPHKKGVKRRFFNLEVDE